MSYNNHDNEDPNRIKYVKENKEFTEEDSLNGKAIKLYTMAQTMKLSEFMKWFKENPTK